MILKPSLMNFISIGLMAFTGVWIIERVLILAGVENGMMLRK